MQPQAYDLIVIGSGPAGEKGAAQAAYFGKRVALIEREPVLGGTAANTGTLPSKTLRETALFLSGFRHRQLDGLDFRGLKKEVSVADFLGRKQLIVQRERDRIRANLDRHHVILHGGTAEFLDVHTVRVSPPGQAAYDLRGDCVLVATGSYPFRPPSFNFADPRLYDSDTVLGLRAIPARMLVLGGGVVGCEYACMFAELGIQVTLVEKRERLIGFLDADIVAVLQGQMKALGMRLFLGDSVACITYGEKSLEVRLQSGAVVDTDTILVSSGRCGNTISLGLERIGLAVDERGRIPVNDRYQTNVPNIYAAGDVIGSPALASTAMEQARVAMVHAFQLSYKQAVAPILPYGIFTIPECSMAGATEESLQKQQVAYVAGKADYAHNARGQIIGDSIGFLKLLFHASDMKLLGVHIIGEQATELVHIGLTALLAGAGADLFIQTCYNYPTLGELYKYATYDALGRRSKIKPR